MENDPKQFSSDKLAFKKVLELGSGCGLGGISMMIKGCRVTFTDIAPVVDALTLSNVRNSFGRLTSQGAHTSISSPIQRPAVRYLDWTSEFIGPDLLSAVEATAIQSDTVEETEPESKIENTTELESYDIILLTDCVFSVTLVPDLLKTILKFCGTNSTVICCHEIRDEVVLNISYILIFG